MSRGGVEHWRSVSSTADLNWTC